jgi:hypothetical protein
VLGLYLPSFSAHFEPMSLTDHGRPVASICLPNQGDAADARAAEILQAWVRKMSGATLRIERSSVPKKGGVNIGFSSRDLPQEVSAPSSLIPDGFFLGDAGATLYIVSGGHKGAIYGVVDLLEKQFGCRMFSPTAEYCPKNPTLRVAPVNYSDSPMNTFRCVNGEFSANPDYRDWMRLDAVEDIYAKGYYVHTSGKLVPPATYFSNHPDYFEEIDGQRRTAQICPSNPAVEPIIEDKLRQEMALQPDKSVWGVSQNDNPTYCQDPLCAKVIAEEGSPGAPMLRLINKIAAQFPNKTIATLAYEFSRTAPKITKPAPNVMMMLCTIELNRSMPIANDPTSQDFVKDITAWGKICRNIYLWDYTVNFSHSLSPFPNLHILQPNLQFFVRNGALKQFEQTNTSPGHEFSELKSYLLAHLLWNPNCNADAVIDDFLGGYYGAAAPYLRSYIDLMEAELKRSGKRLDIYESPTAHANDYLGVGPIAKYNALFDTAESSVRGSPSLFARVKTARLSLNYAILQIAWGDPFGPRGYFNKTADGYQPKPEMAKLLEDFHNTCLANGVKYLNESKLTPDQYYLACKNLTNLQIKGNLAFGKTITADPPPSPKYGKGDISLLTNGVKGGNDYRIQWLGWEGTNFSLSLDLGAGTNAHEAALDTLYSERDWILHPASVSCEVSSDGVAYVAVGNHPVPGDQQHEQLIRTFKFKWKMNGVRYVRFKVTALKGLPAWHSAAGGVPWAFVDEVMAH